MPQANRLLRSVDRLAKLPPSMRRWLLTFAMGRQVPFVRTVGVRIVELAEGRAVLELRNMRRVQNHLRGVHGAAMAMLAEAATGTAFALNVPDTHLYVVKSMHIDYVKRATGGLRAEATLTEDMRRRVQNDERGDLAVPVRVTDENGEEPIRCQLVWAWLPRKRSEAPAQPDARRSAAA